MTATYGTFPNSTDQTPYANAAALAAVVTSTLYNGYRAQVNGLGVFKLNKDSTATVDDTTVILAASGGRWEKDLTPSLLLNADNEIDGSQISQSGTTLADNGTAAAPSYSFVNDNNSGMYRNANNILGWSTDGVERLTLSTTAMTCTLPFIAPDGTSAAPSFRVTSEASGMFLASTGSLGFSVAGALKANVTASAFNLASGSAYQIDGAQVIGAPQLGFVVPTSTELPDMSSLNGATATADDATVRLIIQAITALTAAGLTHGFLGAP